VEPQVQLITCQVLLGLTLFLVLLPLQEAVAAVRLDQLVLTVGLAAALMRLLHQALELPVRETLAQQERLVRLLLRAVVVAVLAPLEMLG
jgi:4-hydroxybenzoate polyprenyltransferase